jgi:ABC-2 type transport system permease protein
MAVVFGAVVAVGRLPVSGYDGFWDAPGGYVLGTRLGAAGPDVVSTLRGFTGVLFVLLVFLTFLKEVTEGAMDANVESVLLAAGTRSVAVGNVLWNLLLAGWQFGALIVAGALAFGVGSGSPTATLGLVVAGGAMLVTAVPLGYLLALVSVLAFRRVPVLRSHRLLLGAPLAVGYFALFLRIRESMSLVGGSPLGWYADAALAFDAPAADPLSGVVVLAAAPLALVGLSAATVRVGGELWYGDARESAEDTGERIRSTPLDRILATVATRPTAAVTRTVWRRLRREPRTLLFAALPIALTGGAGVELVGQRPAAAPVVVGIYGAATVGMGATLNPLGSLGAGLSTALTAPRGGRHVVRGYALSAAIPGVPAVSAVSFVVGIVVGLPPSPAVALSVVAGTLTAAASVLSMAVGVALPNMEGLRPTGSGVRPPRMWATTAFLLVVVLVGTPALVGVGWGVRIAVATGTTSSIVAAVGVGVTLALSVLAAVLAYGRSIHAIADYTIE